MSIVKTARPASRRKRPIVGIIIAVVAVLVLTAGYLVTFAPANFAAMQAKPADGETAVEIGAGVTVIPPEGWRVQPNVPFGIGFDRTNGVLTKTPDGRLSVAITELTSTDEAAELLRIIGGDTSTTLTEQLASGLTVTHVITPREAAACIETDHGVVLLRGSASDMQKYLPAFSQVLESVAVA